MVVNILSSTFLSIITIKFGGFHDPLHVMGMPPIWSTKQKKFSLLGIEIYSHVKKSYCSGCPPDWLHNPTDMQYGSIADTTFVTP